MMKAIIAGLLSIVALADASAYQVNADVTCRGGENERATLTVTGSVNPEHMGIPGTLYVGLADLGPDGLPRRGYVLDEYSNFTEWDGQGLVPISRILRNGLGSFTFTADVTRFKGDSSLSLWVGYGVLTPDKEAIIQKAKEAIAKARAANPNAVIRDVGDDWRRWSMVDHDLRSNGRYVKVLQRIECSNRYYN